MTFLLRPFLVTRLKGHIGKEKKREEEGLLYFFTDFYLAGKGVPEGGGGGAKASASFTAPRKAELMHIFWILVRAASSSYKTTYPCIRTTSSLWPTPMLNMKELPS